MKEDGDRENWRGRYKTEQDNGEVRRVNSLPIRDDDEDHRLEWAENVEAWNRK